MDLTKITELATVMRALNILRVKTPEMELELWYQEYPLEPWVDSGVKEEDVDKNEVVNEDLYAEAFGGRKPSFR
jgi:hypothetical protein